jgi:hypothetical protein
MNADIKYRPEYLFVLVPKRCRYGSTVVKILYASDTHELLIRAIFLVFLPLYSNVQMFRNNSMFISYRDVIYVTA